MILEIRTYQLKPGGTAEFQRLFRDVSGPMLERHGIAVVGHGPSLDKDDQYVLLRSFATMAERTAQEDSFYGSDEWRQGPREAVLALIVTYHTIALEVTEAAVDELRRGLIS
jgi:hypothetical protein